jgi:NADH dehydrogenase/NADH:ubiquinone oxidoreductase subunit G
VAISLAASTEGTKVVFERALSEGLRGNSKNIDLKAIAYGVRTVTAALRNDDPRRIKWLAALHAAIGKTADSDQLGALAQAYAAVAPKLKEGDPGAAEEVAALRAAIGKTTDFEGRSPRRGLEG